MTKHIQWNGTLSQEGYDILKGEGGCIVCPTKVGYIIMTSDKAGLERKFEAKERNRNKPGVVLCGSMDELRALAQLNPEIEASTKNIGTKIFFSVASFLGNQKPLKNSKHTVMAVKN